MTHALLPSLPRRVRLSTLLLLAALAAPVQSQDDPSAPTVRSPEEERAHLVAAAREVMGAQTYCALVTIDEAGRPQVRTMNPFPPEEDMSVWMATNPRSLKVREIRRDPRVALYYANHAEAIGYVTVHGRAELVDDMREIVKRKRAYWDQAFPGLVNIVLIKVVPERIDVLNYKAGTPADPETWRPPSVELGTGGR